MADKWMNGTMRKQLMVVAVLAMFTWPGAGQSQDGGDASNTEQDSLAKVERQYTAPPETILFESSVGDVHFPHKTHLKMRCKRCHHQIQAEALDTPHEDYLESSWIRCQTCHADSPETGGEHFKCGECHHSELENIADESLSAKVVVHKSCWKCHKTSTGVDASKGCTYCHVKHENGVPAGTEAD